MTLAGQQRPSCLVPELHSGCERQKGRASLELTGLQGEKKEEKVTPGPQRRERHMCEQAHQEQGLLS